MFQIKISIGRSERSPLTPVLPQLLALFAQLLKPATEAHGPDEEEPLVEAVADEVDELRAQVNELRCAMGRHTWRPSVGAPGLACSSCGVPNAETAVHS